MFKRLVFVFGVIIALGFFYYIFTAAAGALASDSFLSLPGTIISSGSINGLKVVDFSQFAKGGPGWNYITQGYGDTPYSYMYINHWHNGIDIAADYGAPVYSPVGDASVLATGDQDDFCPRLAFGRFVVIIDPGHGVDLLFAHLNQIFVTPGETVGTGTEFATIGATGDETGPHLHFSVFKAVGFSMAPAHGCGPYPQGQDINPVPYLESVE